MKLTKAQTKMVERIANICGDKHKSSDGYCEHYDVIGGHYGRDITLDKLLDLKVVTKWHSKQKRRSCWGGSSSKPDGFTLYKLAPIGIKMVFERIRTEEKANTLDKRIAQRLELLRISDADLKKASIVLD